MRFVCVNCGYVYDEERGDKTQGVDPGTPFDSLPETWVCPVCYADKDRFDPMD